MSVAHIDAGTHVNRYVGGNIDRDVACARLQIGIVTLSTPVFTSFTVIPPAPVSARAEGTP